MAEENSKPHKKIVATEKVGGLREQFKKSFLPLLIDVFELRQKIKNYKTSQSSTLFFIVEKEKKTPKEILKKLEEIQDAVEETQRWCEGIIPQISKGIEEAKEALHLIEGSQENACKPDIPKEKKRGLLKRLLNL